MVWGFRVHGLGFSFGCRVCSVMEWNEGSLIITDIQG